MGEHVPNAPGAYVSPYAYIDNTKLFSTTSEPQTNAVLTFNNEKAGEMDRKEFETRRRQDSPLPGTLSVLHRFFGIFAWNWVIWEAIDSQNIVLKFGAPLISPFFFIFPTLQHIPESKPHNCHHHLIRGTTS
jgi:hypothetical protein